MPRHRVLEEEVRRPLPRLRLSWAPHRTDGGGASRELNFIHTVHLWVDEGGDTLDPRPKYLNPKL